MTDHRDQSVDPKTEAQIRASFARQGLMCHLGAQLCRISAGEVGVRLPYRDVLTQQHDYFHAGATSAIGDTAGGYAALSMYPPGSDVLTVSFNLTLIAPAVGTELVATGTVVRAGRTLTTCALAVTALDGRDVTLVAVGQQTSYRIAPQP